MMVKVLRMSLSDYNELLESWGSKARLFDVPSTLDGVKFRGCYTDKTCKEIAVAWPVDRPAFAQDEYAEKYHCGFPVEEFEIGATLNGKVH